MHRAVTALRRIPGPPTPGPSPSRPVPRPCPRRACVVDPGGPLCPAGAPGQVGSITCRSRSVPTRPPEPHPARFALKPAATVFVPQSVRALDVAKRDLREFAEVVKEDTSNFMAAGAAEAQYGEGNDEDDMDFLDADEGGAWTRALVAQRKKRDNATGSAGPAEPEGLETPGTPSGPVVEEPEDQGAVESGIRAEQSVEELRRSLLSFGSAAASRATRALESLVGGNEAASPRGAAHLPGTADARRRAMRSNPSTYLSPCEGEPDYEAWARSFDLSAARDNAAALLDESPEILNAFHSLVPDRVPVDVFWRRYFWREARLKEGEARRARILAMQQPEVEEASIPSGAAATRRRARPTAGTDEGEGEEEELPGWGSSSSSEAEGEEKGEEEKGEEEEERETGGDRGQGEHAPSEQGSAVEPSAAPPTGADDDRGDGGGGGGGERAAVGAGDSASSAQGPTMDTPSTASDEPPAAAAVRSTTSASPRGGAAPDPSASRPALASAAQGGVARSGTSPHRRTPSQAASQSSDDWVEVGAEGPTPSPGSSVVEVAAAGTAPEGPSGGGGEDDWDTWE